MMSNEFMDSKINVVLVHFGINPSPTLLQFAQMAKDSISNTRLILVTDLPEKWKEFPGTICEFNPAAFLSETMKKFVDHNREYLGIANGYWMFTLQRIFALIQIKDIVGDYEPIVHIESDVLLTISREEIQKIISQPNFRTGVPRHSDSEGIGSILIARHISELATLIHNLEKILEKETEWISDMHLLGVALRTGIMDELPSYPDSGIPTSQGTHLIFDGAAAGQYLFGRDPLHSGGRAISGYLNPHFNFNLAKVKWVLREVSGRETIGFQFEGNYFYLGNIHIHSKTTIGRIDSRSADWKRVVNEANGVISRTPGDYVEDKIHTSKTPLTFKILKARKNGLIKTIWQKTRHFKFQK